LAAIAGVYALLVWRERSEYGTALRDAAEKRYLKAMPALERLVSRNTDYANGEAAYQLGLCKLALQQPDKAIAAWTLVKNDSPWAGRAALARARLILQKHGFAEAEPLLRIAINEPGAAGFEARDTLAHILKIQGRWEEVIALHE